MTFQDYIDHGWKLCPIRPGTKSPMGKDWNKKENAISDGSKLRGAGLLHAYSGTMSLDVDDYGAAGAWLEARGVDLDALFADPTSVHIVSGREGSGKLLYACTVPMASVKILEKKRTILEFRCATAAGLSAQCVLPPSIHPETGREYAWRYGNALIGDWRDLPPLPEALEAIWLEQLAPPPDQGIAEDPIAAPAPSAELDELRELLKSHDPSSGRDEWIKVGAALHHETGGAPEGLALWDEWSQGSKKYMGLADLEKDWRSFRSDRPNAVTAGYLRQTAAASLDEFEDVSGNSDDFDPWADLAQERREKFAPVHVADVAKRPAPRWLVKGVLPESDLAMLYGQPGAGKSYLALDMAFAIATGEQWAELDTLAGPVAWIAAEAAGSLRLRTAAYSRQHGMALENADLWIIDQALSLMEPEDATALVSALRDMRPRLIIVDTLAAASGGANENSGEDMNKVLNSCRLLHKETGATILLVHHSGKDESKGARGWSGMKAAMQTELMAVNNEAGRYFTVTKQRDGVEGDSWPVTLIPVMLDEENEACVVELGPKTSNIARRASPARLTGVNALVWRVANEMITVQGGAAISEDVYERVAEQMPPPVRGRPDNRQTRARMAAQKLSDEHYIQLRDDMIFLPEEFPHE